MSQNVYKIIFHYLSEHSMKTPNSPKKCHRAREFFGILPRWKTSAQQLKDDARKGW